MKKTIKKKKAFTLVELMGVLVIIGVLTAILIPVVNNTLKNQKKEQYNMQLKTMVLAAKNFGSDNAFILPTENDESIFVNLGQLIGKGYLEKGIINPITNSPFSECLIIEIKKTKQGYDYIVDESSLEIENCNIGNYNIIISKPSEDYIKKSMSSYYIVTVHSDLEEQNIKYEIDNSKIDLTGEASGDAKYSIDGDNGIYRLTVQGGASEGQLGFALNKGSILDERGNDVVGEAAKIPEKAVIVDNTAPECGEWQGQSTEWGKERTITMIGIDAGVGLKIGNIFEKTYNNGEIKTQDLIYKVEDKLGNSKECSTTANIYVDTVIPDQPTLENENYGDNWKNMYSTSDYVLKGKSSDSGSGITKWQYTYNSSPTSECNDVGECWVTYSNSELSYIDGNLNEITTSPFTWNRNQNVYIRACDKLNNCSEAASSMIKIDTEAPDAPAVELVQWDWGLLENDTWYNKDVYVAGKADGSDPTPTSADGLSGIDYYEISTNNNNWIKWNYAAEAPYYIEDEGQFNRYVRAVDKAGNVSEVTTKIIKIDKTGPIVTLSGNYFYDFDNQKRLNFSSIIDNGSGFKADNYDISYWHNYQQESGTSGTLYYDNNYYYTFGYASVTNNFVQMMMTFSDNVGNETKINLECRYNNNTCYEWAGY